MSSNLEFHIGSFIATAAIVPNVAVKLDTTAGAVVVAGVNDNVIGFTMANADAGKIVPVRFINGFGSCFMKANAAIALGAPVCVATAGGLVDDSGVGPVLGVTLQAATAQNDVIEVLLKGSLEIGRASASQAVVAQTGAAVATTNAIDLPTAEALANALKVDYNKTITDVAAIVVLLNQLRSDLIAQGLIKGAA